MSWFAECIYSTHPSDREWVCICISSQAMSKSTIAFDNASIQRCNASVATGCWVQLPSACGNGHGNGWINRSSRRGTYLCTQTDAYICKAGNLNIYIRRSRSYANLWHKTCMVCKDYKACHACKDHKLWHICAIGWSVRLALIANIASFTECKARENRVLPVLQGWRSSRGSWVSLDYAPRVARRLH